MKVSIKLLSILVVLTPVHLFIEGRFLDVNLLVQYQKYFVPRKFFILPKRKPLVIIIDDIFRPELLESPGIFEPVGLKGFLRELMWNGINIITSSSSQEITIQESEVRNNKIFKTDFIKDFDRHFENLSEQEKYVLKMIAISQVVDIHLPEPFLKETFPTVFKCLESGLGGLGLNDK